MRLSEYFTGYRETLKLPDELIKSIRVPTPVAPMTAFQYDWNMLPIGQQLWEEHLLSYEKYPPLQAPETYNLSGILAEVKKAGMNHSGD